MTATPPAGAVCIYCGRPIKAGRSCAEHRDLERADPHLLAGGRPLTDAELGATPQHRVPRRAGRRELY